MSRSGAIKNLLLVTSIVVSLSIIVGMQEIRPHVPFKETTTFKFNEGFPTFSPKTIGVLSFGYPFLVSSLLWLRFLQETPIRAVPEGSMSWVYLDLNSISIIDPDFVPVYSHGAMYLSVITSDREGARRLLEKAVSKYPSIWKYRAYLAYHYQYEMNNIAGAAEQYRLAAPLPGAPEYFGLLASTLLEKTGRRDASISILKSMMNSVQDPSIIKRFKSKLKKLENARNE